MNIKKRIGKSFFCCCSFTETTGFIVFYKKNKRKACEKICKKG